LVTGRSALPARADANDLGTTPLECRIRPLCLRVIVGPAFVDGRVDPSLEQAEGKKEKERPRQLSLPRPSDPSRKD